MAQDQQLSGHQLISLVKSSGELELSLQPLTIAPPEAGEIVVKVEATPINPSDLGLLLGPSLHGDADLSTAKVTGTKDSPVVTLQIPQHLMRAVAARLDQPLPVGNEGAGTVVQAGSSPEAQALLGKKVAMLGGAMYATYRKLKASDVLPLPADASAADGASCFVNPLTALAMVETMRRENHTALVHTAAASNLGQMLNRICIKDGVQLVNIVRSQQQARILRDIGAKHIVDSTSANFMPDLVAALTETGATIAFDAIGGGKLASQILSAMEQAAAAKLSAYNRYGSNTFKQVYIYGALDTGPTELVRSYGFAWAVSGFLLTPFLQKIGPAETNRLRQRVASELKTTFASHYTQTLSLRDVLDVKTIEAYNRKATGEKFLIDPSR